MKKFVSSIICCVMVLALTLQVFALVSVPVTGIRLDISKVTLQIGQAATIKTTLSPSNTTQRLLTYTTSNKNVASIDVNGTITAVGEGSAVITVTTQNSKVSAKVNVTVPKKGKPAELTVEVFDRGVQGQPDLNNNFWTKYINENFGKQNNVNVTFVPVVRSQEVDKLNILMAAGTAPDICFTYDQATVLKYINSNGLTELGGLIDQYGTNLKSYLKDTLKYGVYDGKQYVVPAKRISLAVHSQFIRKDWLDKLNMNIPTTRDEFYKVLVAFKEKNPGNVSGVIPLGLCALSSSSQFSYGSVLESYWNLSQAERDITTIPGATSLLDWSRPGTKEGMAFLNKLYNEKLISPDFAIDKTGKQLEADIVNGRVGFFDCNYDYPFRDNPGLYANLKKNVPGAKLVVVDCFKNTKGEYAKGIYNTYGIFNIIPKYSKHAAQAVQYLNWLSQKDTINYLQFGPEGQNHKTGTDGLPVPVPQTGDKMIVSALNVDYTIITNGADLYDTEKNQKMISKSYPAFETDMLASYKMATTDGYEPWFSSIPNASYTKFGPALINKNNDIRSQLIACKPEDFNEKYNSLVADYTRSGALDIVNEQRANYKKVNGQSK
jgi:putative aldouronate transport system substrate-binding protein